MRKVVRKQPDRNVKTRRQNIEEPGKISGRMEDLYQRFPHLSEQIFDSLDNRSLFACKEVSRSWHQFLDGQKFLQIRIIQRILEGTEWGRYDFRYTSCCCPTFFFSISFDIKLWYRVFHRCDTKKVQ